MTTITTYRDNPCRLRAEGHSGYAEAGADIVCAGVSALMWALLAAADEAQSYHAWAHIDEGEAVIDVSCAPDESAKERCAYLFGVIRGGLEALAEEYPDNIRIKEAET